MNVAAVAPGAVVRNGFRDPAYLAAVGVPHDGADLAVPVGTPVLAPAGGVVIFAGADDASGDGGLGVKLSMGDAGELGFWHLSSVGVAVGQTVAAGQAVGLSGQTGNAAYPHVHLQLEQPRGNPVDPVAWLAMLGPDPWTSSAAPAGPVLAAGVPWRTLAIVGGLALAAWAILDDD